MPTRLFAASLALLYFLIGCIGIRFHEIWSDEAHHFLLARDSGSIGELYHNAAYDGHPLLWNLLLFFLTHFSTSVFWMQVLNVILMSYCVYLFMRHAPFKKTISVLIVFGYLFLYEYLVISRNYAISMLLLTLLFSRLNQAVRHHKQIALILLVFFFTHIFAIIIGLVLCLILIYENKNIQIRGLYTLIIVAGVLLLFSLQVPADHFLFRYDTDPLLSAKRFGKAFSMFLKGFLPLPDFRSEHPWNSNLIISFSKPMGAILSFCLALLPFFLFRKNKSVLFFFYASAFGICLFSYLSPLMVASRHCGFLFILLVFSFWLQKINEPLPLPEKPVFKLVATLLLFIHLCAGFFLFITDLQRPFSNAQSLAGYLKENQLSKRDIYHSNSGAGPSLCAYLGQTIFYLENGKKESFCRWNTWPFLLSNEQLAAKLQQLTIKDGSLLILSNTDSLQGQLQTINTNNSHRWIKLKTFDNAIVGSENYTAYLLRHLQATE